MPRKIFSRSPGWRQADSSGTAKWPECGADLSSFYAFSETCISLEEITWEDLELTKLGFEPGCLEALQTIFLRSNILTRLWNLQYVVQGPVWCAYTCQLTAQRLMKRPRRVIVRLRYSWSNGTAVRAHVNVCTGCKTSASVNRGAITAGKCQHQPTRVNLTSGLAKHSSTICVTVSPHSSVKTRELTMMVVTLSRFRSGL
jgi:hypothetical protein